MQDTTVGGGRHRWGTPGLIAVTTLVTVARRGLFRSWFTPGRHRWTPPAPREVRRHAPAHAL